MENWRDIFLSHTTIAIVTAHPDDETICGMTLARYCLDYGNKGVIICFTQGERGVAFGERRNPHFVRHTRSAELQESCKTLGLSCHHFLGFEDTPRNDLAWNQLEALKRVVRMIREIRPDIIITFAPTQGVNRHPDHIAVSRITTEAFDQAADANSFSYQLELNLSTWQPKKLYYMIGPPEFFIEHMKKVRPNRVFKMDPEPITLKIRGSDFSEKLGTTYAEKCFEAYKCHKSQGISKLVDYARKEFQKPFWEYFSLAKSTIGSIKKERSMLDGLSNQT